MRFVSRQTADAARSAAWRSLAAIACLCSAGLAPAAAQNKNEIWPELDLWHRVDDRRQVVISVGRTRDKELGDKTDGLIGVALDFRRDDRVSYRAGYLFLPGKSSVKGQTSAVENRLTFDFTYRWPLPHNSILSNRTRMELRFQGGDVAERYRNRLRLEHTTAIRRLPVVPYANAEIYYDSRVKDFSRYRIEAGIDLVLSDTVDVDVYIGRQQNIDQNSLAIDGIGVTVGLHF